MAYTDMNEYQQRDFNNQVKIIEQLNSFDSGYKWQLVESNESNHYQIMLKGLYPIYCRYDDYRKQYNFSLWYKLPYINYHNQNDYTVKNPNPQNVGVLNAKKIKTWVDYYITMFEALAIISKQKSLEIEAFKQEVREATKTTGVIFRGGEKSGWLDRNGIQFSYEIDESSGWISKKTECRFTGADSLNNFLALSDNKFISKND